VIDQFDDEKIRIVNNPETVTLLDKHNVCLKKASFSYNQIVVGEFLKNPLLLRDTLVRKTISRL